MNINIENNNLGDKLIQLFLNNLSVYPNNL